MEIGDVVLNEHPEIELAFEEVFKRADLSSEEIKVFVKLMYKFYNCIMKQSSERCKQC